MCKKACKKLHALYRICNYMTLSQRRIIMKAFLESQFGYCPLVWIFHGDKNLNSVVNNIQERVLHLLYNDYRSPYDQLVAQDGSFKIHHQNVQRLAIEIYNFNNYLGPEILNDIFAGNSSHYNTRSDIIMYTRNVKSVFNGNESVSYRAQRTIGT